MALSIWALACAQSTASVAAAAQEALGERFGQSAQVRTQSLELSASAIAQRLGPANLEVESRVAIEAKSGAHHQVDHVQMTWDDANAMMMVHTCGAAPLEVWRLGDALLVRADRGPMRQKSSRDMDAQTLFDQAAGTFAQALAWVAPLRYLDGQGEEALGRPAWRYRIEVAPTGPAPHPAQAPAAHVAASRPALWRHTLAERQAEGFVVVDQATGIVVTGELTAQATLTHPQGGAAKISALVRHHMQPRRRQGALAAPPAVNEFRRPLRARDPIAFYRQRGQPPPAKPKAKGANALPEAEEGEDEGGAD